MRVEGAARLTDLNQDRARRQEFGELAQRLIRAAYLGSSARNDDQRQHVGLHRWVADLRFDLTGDVCPEPRQLSRELVDGDSRALVGLDLDACYRCGTHGCRQLRPSI